MLFNDSFKNSYPKFFLFTKNPNILFASVNFVFNVNGKTQHVDAHLVSCFYHTINIYVSFFARWYMYFVF